MTEQELIIELSPAINCIYSLAIIVEGLAVDIGSEKEKDNAIKMRKQIAPTCAEDFGDWSDKMEERVLRLKFNKDTIMNCCIELMIELAMKVEKRWRQYDPFFCFYQADELMSMRKKRVNPYCYKQLRKLIYEKYVK